MSERHFGNIRIVKQSNIKIKEVSLWYQVYLIIHTSEYRIDKSILGNFYESRFIVYVIIITLCYFLLRISLWMKENPILLKAKFMFCVCSSPMLLNFLEVRYLITNSFNRKRSVETWVVNSIDVKLMPRFHFLCHNSLTVNQAIEIPSLHCESRKETVWVT